MSHTAVCVSCMVGWIQHSGGPDPEERRQREPEREGTPTAVAPAVEYYIS